MDIGRIIILSILLGSCSTVEVNYYNEKEVCIEIQEINSSKILDCYEGKCYEWKGENLKCPKIY